MSGSLELGHHSSLHQAQDSSKCLDEDGRTKRTGTVWTASAHIITAVIGSGVLSLAWAIAQLGWVAGPIVMLLFAVITYYTSTLLADCYRYGDPITGRRNYDYMATVQSYLAGGIKFKFCGFIQYANLFGVAIGYTIASSISMMAIQKANCYHKQGHNSPCHISGNFYTITYGVMQIFLSQIPDFDEIWWLSIVAAIMSFTYSGIGLGLGIAAVVGKCLQLHTCIANPFLVFTDHFASETENKGLKGSLTGISIGHVTQSQKIWQTLQALGNIAFAYSFAMILIEIQDTIKAPPPSEAEVMKKASLLSTLVTTVFYMFCGCMGYGAFGDDAPGNLLTGFGFYEPYWLLDIANAAIVVHLVGAYQVFCQPLFSFIEKCSAKACPASPFITSEIAIPLGSNRCYKLNLFRLVWRSVFVVTTTVISMLLPFFNDVVGLLGAIAFWPLTVYFPVEMYIEQNRIPTWSIKWLCLQTLSVTCCVVSLSAAVGSIAGIINDLKAYEPFKSSY
ncbi:amino acid permease 4-like isoform X1 [Canna indica]|uniref:Amino acid permease 4-like isoform X1 n=1 Tax=Canna indica TaxID=4628 RepID=A0AAQ3Q606_9LILI|nr:amino acid permease 4-like isoform X1 [Canna indica]